MSVFKYSVLVDIITICSTNTLRYSIGGAKTQDNHNNKTKRNKNMEKYEVTTNIDGYTEERDFDTLESALAYLVDVEDSFIHGDTTERMRVTVIGGAQDQMSSARIAKGDEAWDVTCDDFGLFNGGLLG